MTIDEHLFSPPYDFSSVAGKALFDTLCRAYSTRESIALAVKFSGLQHYQPEQLADIRIIWMGALERISNAGHLPALIEYAVYDPGVAAYHDRLRRFLPPSSDQQWLGKRGGEEEACVFRDRPRWVDAMWLRRIVETLPSICSIQVTAKHGTLRSTGFLIEREWVLTCWHAIKRPDLGEPSEIQIEFPSDSADTPVIRKGCLDTIRGEGHDGDTLLDWAAFRLDQPVERRPLRLDGPRDPHPDDGAVIIHHPGGRSQRVSIEARAVRHADENTLHYLLDTEPGSSGAPVFTAQMQLVALHRAAGERDTLSIGGVSVPIWRNVGTRMRRIVRRLADEGVPHEAA